MSGKERKEFSASIKQYQEKLSEDTEASRRFLADAGIITPKGNLREPYKHLPLCIQQDPFFVKKNKRAAEVIKKYGVPDHFVKKPNS